MGWPHQILCYGGSAGQKVGDDMARHASRSAARGVLRTVRMRRCRSARHRSIDEAGGCQRAVARTTNRAHAGAAERCSQPLLPACMMMVVSNWKPALIRRTCTSARL